MAEGSKNSCFLRSDEKKTATGAESLVSTMFASLRRRLYLLFFFYIASQSAPVDAEET